MTEHLTCAVCRRMVATDAPSVCAGARYGDRWTCALPCTLIHHERVRRRNLRAFARDVADQRARRMTVRTCLAMMPNLRARDPLIAALLAKLLSD